MVQKWLLASITGAAVLTVAAYTYLATPAKSKADPAKSADPPIARVAPAAAVAAAPSETSVQLPIGQVVLFSSGVGYFQREGQIEGDARVDLSFPVSDINDLIKSMVLRDLDGGHIAAVSYDSNAPVEKTLQSFAVNLSANPTFGQILNQARGEKVEVVLAAGQRRAAGNDDRLHHGRRAEAGSRRQGRRQRRAAEHVVRRRDEEREAVGAATGAFPQSDHGQ